MAAMAALPALAPRPVAVVSLPFTTVKLALFTVLGVLL